MAKFRIVEERLEGTENIVWYYVQKREWILFIPYWKSLIHSVTLAGFSRHFYNINDAKEFIKKYREGSRRVVYKE